MIRRVELHNFANHEDTELEFGNGKNVIIGATGSGKTNILQALDFAFLGDVPNVNLPELISDKSDAMEVTLEYEDPRTGQSYRIRRSLTRTPDSKAEHECSVTNLDTNETIKKPEPVRKTLESFGVDAAIWKYVVHIPQGQFGDILEETQERKISLDKLFQVSQLENTHQELGRRDGPIGQIDKRKQEKEQARIRLEETSKHLDQEEKNLKHLTAEKKKKELELDKTRREYEKLNNIAQKNTQTINQIVTVEEAINKSRLLSENAASQINTLIDHLQGILPEPIRAELKQVNSSQIATYIQKLSQDLHDTTEEQNIRNIDYTTSIEQSAQIKSQLDLATSQKTTTLKELEDIEKYLTGKAKEPQIACNRCGTILTKTQWNIHITELEAAAKDIEKQTGHYASELKLAQAKINERKKLLEDVGNKLTTLGHAITIVKQIEQQRLIIGQNKETELARTRADLLTQLRSLLLLEPTMTDQDVINHALSLPNDLKRTYTRMEELTNDIESFEEKALKPQIRRVALARDAQTQLASLLPEIELEQKKISILELIRTSLRDIQPVVRRSFVARITQTANDYLKRLYGDAELENFTLTEDYQFIITRAGYKRHARRLSGGQQVLASMAFLLALSEVISQLDFLILDEPTTHLDSSRRRELVNVLEHLRRVPQLIIVDHHQELLEAADTAFQATLNPDGTSQVSQKLDQR